ncbi:MAG: AAA family ATPase [Anaeromyxobacteraceae bacterium]
MKGYLGEGDFVLAHPARGLLVLEVKGGHLRQESGQWTSNGTPLDKAPLDQARGYLTKLLGRLDGFGSCPPAWGAAAAVPDTVFDRQPEQADLSDVGLGRTQLHWFAESFPAIVKRALPAASAADARGDWIQRLHKLWGETWVPSLSLGARVKLGEEKRLALDAFQLFTLDALAEHDRALVQGGAGTGKTLIAVEAARRAAQDGKKVLLLCFTQALRKWLAARLAGTGVDVETVSGLAKKVAEAATGPWGAKDLTDSEQWRKYFESAMDCCEPRWDVVLVDEAQDLPYEAWFFVKALSDGRRLWAFHDPGQGFWKDRSPPSDLFPPPFKLTRGQRSPAGVAALAERYAGCPADEKVIARAVADDTLGLVACPAQSSTAHAVALLVDKLTAQGLLPGDIGIVSLRGQTAPDALHRQPRLGHHAFALADADDMEGRLVVDSFLRWKGLERPVIVVADVTGDLKELGTRMHIALTRALTAARVVAPPGDASGAWPGLPAR